MLCAALGFLAGVLLVAVVWAIWGIVFAYQLFKRM